jgi:cellulose synthase operon protein C
MPPSTLLPRRRLALRLAALTFALSPLACGTGALSNQRPPSAEGRAVPVDVRDEDFSASLFSLVRDGKPSEQRSSLLIGVVRRQLAHAAARFGARQPERGTDSVLGALYLLRAGEGHAEMIDAAGERALAGAIERLSPRGDEGRVRAMMDLRAAALPAGSAPRAAVDEHIAALDRWMKDTRTGGPLEQSGAEERAAVSRALVDSRAESVQRAADAIAAWIDRAIQFNIEYRQSGGRPERDEAVEAARALESGGATMAALFLRHGDARGRVIPPGLYQRIKAAAADDDAGSWQALTAAFAHYDTGERDEEIGMSQELLEGALWGTALEAYRRDPKSYDSAALVAQVLIRLGMSEAAPLVVATALGDKPDATALGSALGLVLTALSEDASIEDFAATRRTYLAAAPLLVLGDRAAQGGAALDPSSGRVRFLMASIELRAGNLAAAMPLLRSATAAEPTVSSLTLLAMAERQAGEAQAALEDVRRALGAPDVRIAPLEVTEAHLLAFELHREAGAHDRAKESLEAALQGALDARLRARDPGAKTRAERLLGRVLDAYGDAKGSARASERARARASERALALATSERPLLGATMLDAVGRALVRRDLAGARTALKRGLEANADEEDLVYGGLWVLLLERELRVGTDGTAGHALDIATNRASWTAKLASWANGRISDADLSTLAQSAAQRVEAQFYTAMAKRVAGDPAADERLRAVSKSPILDLLEVHLAREMLAPSVRPELPRNVSLP